MYPRFVKARIQKALTDTRVVLLSGPRQSGKTTLAADIASSDRHYVTLDNHATLKFAIDDPVGFIRDRDKVIIDEVQKAPALLSSIKQSVDFDSSPGRFLLTGSANLLTMSNLPDSLAGRMEVIPIFPMSQAELHGKPSAFIDRAFAAQAPQAENVILGKPLIETVLCGGYAEPLGRKEWVRKQDWFDNYLETLIQRDVQDIGRLDRVAMMPELLQILAEHAGQLVNYSKIGQAIGSNHASTKKYVKVLESLYQVYILKPWSKNRLKRQVKSPKLHFLDAGLLASIKKASIESIQKDRTSLGPILETFVCSEIMKIAAWSEHRCAFFHFRDKQKNEVDLIIENQHGEIVGIEVKSSATARPRDFAGLMKLSEACGAKFIQGIVLFDSDQTIPFKEKFYAAPISSLWGAA